MVASHVQNLENARGDEFWLMARGSRYTAAAGRPGTSLELVVRRAIPEPLASGAGSSRGELGQAKRATSMMLWIREYAHHLLAAATWELSIDDKRGETRLESGAWQAEGCMPNQGIVIKEIEVIDRV